MSLEEALRTRLARGGHAFVPYVTGGFPGVDARLLRGLQEAGADAIEVGIPFSDPVMDGGVIQEASARALDGGATPTSVLDTIHTAALTVPVAVMTYVNPVHRIGPDAFVELATDAGVSALIVPDLPIDEASDMIETGARRGIEVVLLASPGASKERFARIGAAATGFVYCVTTYGVTGARSSLAETAREVVEAMRPHTSLPLLVGVGIATPEQAEASCAFADGVIVGSALMSPMLSGRPDEALRLARAFRAAIPPG